MEHFIFLINTEMQVMRILMGDYAGQIKMFEGNVNRVMIRAGANNLSKVWYI